MSTTPAPERDGGQLGELEADYELVREIGRGATGTVYLARRIADGREVAVKIVQRASGTSGGAPSPELDRCAHEARTVARLRHRNIVRHRGVCVTREGGLALVMEYVHGETLRRVLQAQPCPPYDAVESVLRDVAAALDHAHRHGVVHRDVKPENIFIDADRNRALLSDFDIAASGLLYFDAPTDGVVMGTPRYMAPEQIDGAVVDARSDLYSLGLVGWEMLAGQRPWAAGTMDEVLYRQKHEELPSVRTLRPDVPARLALAIEAATQKTLSFRVESAAELLEQLAHDVPVGRTAMRRTYVPRVPLTTPPLPVPAIPAPSAPVVDESEPTVVVERRPAGEAPPDGEPGSAIDAAPPRLRRRVVIALALAGVAGTGAAVALGSGWHAGPAPDPAPMTIGAGVVGGVVADTALPVAVDASSPDDQLTRAALAYVAAYLPPSDSRSAGGTEGAGLSDDGRPASAASPPAGAASPPPAPWRGAVLEMAAALLDSAVAARPADPGGYLLRARVAAARGDLRSAWADAEIATRLGRAWEGEALSALADVAGRDTARARTRALSLLGRVRQLTTPLDASAGGYVALALAAVGEREAAVETLLRIRPADDRLRAVLDDPGLAAVRDHPRLAVLRGASAP